ncbi:hypothetical protein [Bacillus sp. RO1]|uniref:hypothetical protein n=1 Tax=Bacillus sp. RO1 TaxID=2722703 RepID=UPI001456E58C|nr:hypothetical protein [Bacillus sp. RO1]NLP51277.1 hypothetical protein [Bacillus sp. RO1]
MERLSGIELLVKGYDKTQEEHKDDKQADILHKEERKGRELTPFELLSKGYEPKEDKENETKEGE